MLRELFRLDRASKLWKLSCCPERCLERYRGMRATRRCAWAAWLHIILRIRYRIGQLICLVSYFLSLVHLRCEAETLGEVARDCFMAPTFSDRMREIWLREVAKDHPGSEDRVQADLAVLRHHPCNEIAGLVALALHLIGEEQFRQEVLARSDGLVFSKEERYLLDLDDEGTIDG